MAKKCRKCVPINLALYDFLLLSYIWTPCRLICMQQGNRFGIACVTRAAAWGACVECIFMEGRGSDLFYSPLRGERVLEDHTLARRYQLEEICSRRGDWALLWLGKRFTTLIWLIVGSYNSFRSPQARIMSNKALKSSVRSPVPKAMKRRGERRLTIKWPCGFGNCFGRRRGAWESTVFVS